MPTYAIQVRWVDEWITVQRGYISRDAAEWRIAQWKQLNNCTGDPFRVIQGAGLVEHDMGNPVA